MDSKTVLLFAGQGSQFVGMGRELVESFPVCAGLFESASDVLGYDMGKLCFEGPLEILTRTDRCQPAIFVVSAVCVAALREVCPEVKPVAAAGLSLGEWTALYYAGVIGFEDTLRVLELRGAAMQEACEALPGGMVSVIGMPVAELEPLADAAGAQISNINAPDQVVLSGTSAAVEAAAEAALAGGARKTIPLQVAGAYHSRLMQPAAERLEAALEGITLRNPSVPVASNATGKPHDDAGGIKRAMVSQVVSTVRWLDNMRWLLDQGATTFIECGPGKVLSNLIKRLDRSPVVTNIQDLVSLEATRQTISG